jgi:hypothetical protein
LDKKVSYMNIAYQAGKGGESEVRDFRLQAMQRNMLVSAGSRGLVTTIE